MSVPSVNIGGGIRRSANGKVQLMNIPFKDEADVNTPFHCMKRSASKFGDSDFLGHREKFPNNEFGEYKWKKYSDTYSDVLKYGLGLKIVCGVSSGKAGPHQPRIGVYAVNRPEALEAVLAIWSRRGVTVPFYDTLIPDAVDYLIDHAELSVVFVERAKLPNLLKGHGSKGSLKHLVLFEVPTEEERRACRDAGLNLTCLGELAKAAEGQAEAPEEPRPEDWAYVMYTSGTTGTPKGVVLLHSNLLAGVTGTDRGAQHDAAPFFRTDDIYISYLPMAHIYEVNMLLSIMTAGGKVGFFQGNIKKMIVEDLPKLRPTFMAGVPRVFGQLHDKVMQKVEGKGSVAKFLFRMAFANQAWLQNTFGIRNPLWDVMFFDNVKNILGGRVRLVLSAAAPLSPSVQTFLRVCLGCPASQGFGMTETSGATIGQHITLNTVGNIGGPTPTCEVKLIDTADYKTTDIYPKTAAEFDQQVSFKGSFDPQMAGKVVERGELLVRGHNIFAGYFKMEKETAAALDPDGWFHTEDIAQWEPDGSVRIIDRKKDIFKLAHGEYVSPESVEAAVLTSKWVTQAWVYGNSFETGVVAMIVPDMEFLRPWITSKDMKGTVEEICGTEEVKTMIMEDIVQSCRQCKLRSFEIPIEIAFETKINELGQGFTIDEELLTPTMKLKRPQLLKKYKTVIDACYERVKVRQAKERSAAT